MSDLLSGHHDYLSTACLHLIHNRCRLTCKFCKEPCKCPCHGELWEDDSD